jgi:hypothetical protein
MASNFYRANDAPRYILGHSLEIGFVGMGLIAVSTLAFCYNKINKTRDKQVAEGEHLQYTPEQLAEMGDRAVTFRYIL